MRVSGLKIQNPNTLVAFEDRSKNEVGLMLLALSARKHAPNFDLHLFAPNASPALIQWCAENEVSLQATMVPSLGGWNSKGELVLWGLDQGYKRAIFLDADIILANTLPEYFSSSSAETLIVAQQRRYVRERTHLRTTNWGLKPGRSFLRDPSACCLGVTDFHRPLIEEWQALLSSEQYGGSQQLRLDQRPKYSRGSDDVLIALLGSETYANLDIQFVSSFSDIAQCMHAADFSLEARLLSHLSHLPALIHAMGRKPWNSREKDPNRVFAPYTCVARQYRSQLPGEQDWLDDKGVERGFWLKCFEGSPAMATFPAAFKGSLSRVGLRSILNNLRYYRSGG